jgi:hypothetical protein
MKRNVLNLRTPIEAQEFPDFAQLVFKALHFTNTIKNSGKGT